MQGFVFTTPPANERAIIRNVVPDCAKIAGYQINVPSQSTMHRLRSQKEILRVNQQFSHLPEVAQHRFKITLSRLILREPQPRLHLGDVHRVTLIVRRMRSGVVRSRLTSK